MQIIKELKKKGYISLAKKIEKKAKAGGWSDFFDPLTKQHIIKTGRLPGKEESSTGTYSDTTYTRASDEHIRGDKYKLPTILDQGVDESKESETTADSARASRNFKVLHS